MSILAQTLSDADYAALRLIKQKRVYRRQVEQAHVDWIQSQIAHAGYLGIDWMLDILYEELARRTP